MMQSELLHITLAQAVRFSRTSSIATVIGLRRVRKSAVVILRPGRYKDTSKLDRREECPRECAAGERESINIMRHSVLCSDLKSMTLPSEALTSVVNILD